MKAVTYQGPNNVAIGNVKDAATEKRDDIVVKITSTAICGSDLHLPLEQADYAYRIFNGREDNCIKVVLKP